MPQIGVADIAKRIRMLRGQLALPDVDLASLFGVARERIAELVLQNPSKFPVEFCLSIEPSELRDLNLGIAASRSDGSQRAWLAFTEHGVILAATVLRSPHAVAVSILIVRAFVKLREALPTDTELVRRTAALEKSIATLDAEAHEQFEEICRAIRALSMPSSPNMRSDGELH